MMGLRRHPEKRAASGIMFLILFLVCGQAGAAGARDAELPMLDIWPGANAVGEESIVGNPASLSFKIDNGGLPLTDLDGSSFKIRFDGIDLTDGVFMLPARSFVVHENSVTINISGIPLPPGRHTVRLEIGNQGRSPSTITREISVQSNPGFQIGFHMPPIEDWEAPYTDWSIELNRANAEFERHHTLIGFFTSWADSNGNYTEFNSFLSNQIVGLGAVPVITWEPWREGGGPSQDDYSLRAIIQGAHDPYIKRFAGDVVAFGKPLILRIMHEFNGVYYPWSGAKNDNNPGLFVQAFHHIVDIFRAEGANNAEFMWSPNYSADARVPAPSNDIESYYPGDDYVDWIGVSGYNWGTNVQMQAQGWLSFVEIFDGAQFGRFLTAMANRHPNKSVIIAEIGCNNGDAWHSKSDWIREAYRMMKTYANLAGVVWFTNTAYHDAAGLPADFRVIANTGDSESVDPSVTEAYRNAVR